MSKPRKWNRARTCIGLCLALLCASGAMAQQPPAKAPSGKLPGRVATKPTGSPIRHVIIVSVDGMMPETYLQPDAYGLKVPTLREMVANGAYSEGVLGVFPTVTYPSHTSIGTGTNPGTHGIVANGPWDPMNQVPRALRWYTAEIRVPTLWDVAKARGLKTALIYWPVTVGARADAVVQECVESTRKLTLVGGGTWAAADVGHASAARKASTRLTSRSRRPSCAGSRRP